MSGASLIFNSKQLEELESLHDSTGAFEEESDESGMDDVGEGAMEWRRGLIEEAAEAVKRAKTRPVDPSITYEIGSLLFDRESRRFGRVNRSVPGYLRIVYLTGGDREYGVLDVQSYLQEVAITKKLSELALQLGMPEADVERELDRLGLTVLEEDGAGDEDTSDDDEMEAGSASNEAEEVEEDDDLDEDDVDDELEAAPAKAKAAKSKAPAKKAAAPKAEKAPAKKAAAKSSTKAAKAPAKADKAEKADKKAAASSGKKANPIDDPNEFIKQNYVEMSNRELARHTGLSEHTIRRKLGEWGLKRKK